MAGLKRHAHLLRLLLAGLLLALAYLGGALAPSLLDVRASGSAAPAAITRPQLTALRAATDLLLGEVDSETVYLPLIRR